MRAIATQWSRRNAHNEPDQASRPTGGECRDRHTVQYAEMGNEFGVIRGSATSGVTTPAMANYSKSLVTTTERFRDCCLEAVDQGAPSLLLNLSTSGGSTNFGLTLYIFLKSLPIPLCAINAGNIESMGIIKFLAAGKRITSPHSRFLIYPMN